MAAAPRSRARLIFRARVASAFFVFFALVLLGRLYFVQIMQHDKYEDAAMGQYVGAVGGGDDRGGIYFTSKDRAIVSAAVQQSGWLLAIQPIHLEDAEAAYVAINEIVPVDRARFMRSASRENDPYEEIINHLDDATARAIRERKIPGVVLARDRWRLYPANTLAANVLGYVGWGAGGTEKVGLYGLEKFYQDTLAQDAASIAVNPFAEIFASAQTLVTTDPTEHEGSVVTSLEPTVQRQLEDTLDEVMRSYGPRIAGGIIMDPHTGAIIAMASRPTFDPNAYSLSDASAYSNPLVNGRYELGSIMKPLSMAAAIDSGAVTPATTYNDRGCITVSTYRICNYDRRARGVVPMQEVLNQSLNVGTSFVADTMGYQTLTRYFRAYGLGERTGIDLPGEVVGDLSPLGEGTGPAVNYDTAAFGQGISVSPIAMTRALAVLANGGKLPTPHVATAIKYDTGIMRTLPVPEGTQVITPATAETVTDMLVEVFDTALLNGVLRQEHHSIAAKTGTAQIPRPGGGYYPAGTYLHSFFGYFPAHDPRFIVFLFATEPHGQQYASATLAHPFMDIAQFLINYYNIPPDR